MAPQAERQEAIPLAANSHDAGERGRRVTVSNNRRENTGRDSPVVRVADVVISATLVLLLLPVLLVALVGSAITLRAWPIFVQDRVGRDGQRFRFFKVRTLPVETPHYTDKHHLSSVEIPPFCEFLRRVHADELPQLLHVLRGHMAMVGPRPEMPYLHEQMPLAFARARTSVRPGLTGLWQVSRASGDLIHVSPQYDLFYLAHRSPQLDLWLLVRTARMLLRLDDQITLADIPPGVTNPMADDDCTTTADEVATVSPAAWNAVAGR